MKKKIIFLSMIFSILFSIPSFSPAAEISLIPSLSLKGEYNDNVDFTRTNEEDDFSATITPGISLAYGTDRFTFSANAAFGIVRYADLSENDTENQRYGLGFTYNITERLSFNVDASYVKDTTLESELEETGIVEERSDREHYYGGAGFSYDLTELSTILFNYRHSKTDYELASQTDSTEDSFTATYQYTFADRRNILSLTPSYTQTDSDVTDRDNYGFSIGLLHTFTETLEANVSLGIRYTETEYANISDSEWGWTADASLTKSWATSSLTAGYSRTLDYTDIGESVEVNRFYLTAEHAINERLSAILDTSLYYTKSQGDIGNRDTRYFRISPSLVYSITENHSLELAYSYANEDDRNLSSNSEAEQNRIWLAFNFVFPQKW